MATTQLVDLVRHLHGLAGGRTCEQSDRHLLTAFARCQDQEAFAALVARHGPMVFRVCRRVLHHEQDAEDAVQATFLVLARHAGSIRKQEAVAQWLHGVALRTARMARRSATRRLNHEARAVERRPAMTSSPTWDDVQAVLDEEIQSLPGTQRSAFVLCVLEGKTVREAAAQLGVKEGTTSSRLTRARQLLQRRLKRRGIELTALLAALSIAANASRAALPATLMQAIVRFGPLVAAGSPVAGLVPSHVAALAAGVTRAMFLMKAKLLTTVLFLTAVFTAAALWAKQAPSAKPPVAVSPPGAVAGAREGSPAAAAASASDEAFTYKGRVLGPDGRPISGAKLYLIGQGTNDKAPAVRTASGKDGRFEFTAARKELLPAEVPADIDVFAYFQVVALAEGHAPDWTVLGKRPESELSFRLPPNDVTIEGRILDLQGKAVAGAKVKVVQVETTLEDDLAPFMEAWRTGLHEHMAIRMLKKVLFDPSLAGLPRTVTTDASGRFRLPGAGKERMLTLLVEAPQIEHATLHVLPRSAAEAKALLRPVSESMMRRGNLTPPLLYGARFDHVVAPARLITGTVRDKESGKPMSGVRISGSPTQGSLETHLETYTDKEGRYELRGLPKASKYRLSAWPGDYSKYIPGAMEVAGGEGVAAATADFDLVRGIEVQGRVTDKVTGKPVRAGVRYVPLENNKHPGAAYYRMHAKNCEGPRIGTFREMVPPGPGVFLVTVRGTGDENAYTQAQLDPADRDKAGLSPFLLQGVNAYRLADVPADGKPPTFEVQVDPGLSVTGKVLQPDGKPLRGAMMLGRTAGWFTPTSLEEAAFTVVALGKHEDRELVFVHLKRKLAGRLVLHGDEKKDVTVQLGPWATVTGRVRNEDGKPMANVRIHLGYTRSFFFIPTTWWAPQPAFFQTDRDGRFRAEGLVPGMKALLSASTDKKMFLPLAGTPDGQRQLSFKAGEVQDLGDLTVRPE
jgi:RNA polymerase sigma factor (sigma-70 family)